MRRRLLTVLMTVALTMVATGVLFAAATAPKFTYSESWAEKLVRYNEDGEVWYDVDESGKFQITITLPANGIDTQIAADTPFEVEIGGFGGYCTPGEDPKFVAGKSKSAKIVYTEIDDWNGKTIKILEVSLKWNAKSVTATIKGITPWYIEPPLAYDYMDMVGPIVATVPAWVAITTPISPINKMFNVALTGQCKSKYSTKWEDDLFSVSLKGTGTDVTPP